jgi:hypothetical protein
MTFNLITFLTIYILQESVYKILTCPSDLSYIEYFVKIGTFEHIIPRKIKKGKPQNVLVSLEKMNIRQIESICVIFDLLSRIGIGIRIRRSIVSKKLHSFLLTIDWVVNDRNLLDRLRDGQLPCFYAELVSRYQNK